MEHLRRTIQKLILLFVRKTKNFVIIAKNQITRRKCVIQGKTMNDVEMPLKQLQTQIKRREQIHIQIQTQMQLKAGNHLQILKTNFVIIARNPDIGFTNV